MNPILENELLRIEVDPQHGGRVVSLFGKQSQTEFLWYDARRLPINPALDYDGNFAGGMDELLPSDLPEHGFPDHGELWTTPLQATCADGTLTLGGHLPISGLKYQRVMRLQGASLVVSYVLENSGIKPVDFLWKLHAALAIAPGDELLASAGCWQGVDPGDWSKAPDAIPRTWQGSYQVPDMDGTSDFFYLTDLTEGVLKLRRKDGVVLRCDFDLKTFPCAWIFASFGRLNGSRTLILEPCTNYPLSLDDAVKARCCARLSPGESLATEVRWSVQ